MRKSASTSQADCTAQPLTGQMSQERREYQHYVPRFILRNFAHHSEASLLRKQQHNGQKRQSRKEEAGDMLNVLQLEPEIEKTEVPLADAFGQWDMYRDLKLSAGQQHIERLLSKLEGAASQIIHKVRTAQENGLPTVQLLRSERDELRRFLFVMRYRGSNQHRRFYHRDIESYNARDRECMVQYMHKKGFKKPIEVWLDNIRTMAEVKIGKNGKWFSKILQRLYPGDAEWAFVNMELMYLAFCTPSEHSEEFILTENAYDIYEGPVSFNVHPFTGEKITTACTEYHNFAVISPKIIMVLRSILLPNADEDVIPGAREKRWLQREMHRRMHTEYGMTGSFLEDLPVTKARNSYTKIVNGMPVLVDGEDGTPRADHRFDFRFFPLSSEHVQRVNAVILNESHSSSIIAYASPTAARKALEYYLTDPCTVSGAYPLKIVDDPYDQTLLQLQKLERAAKLLGSDVRLRYNIHSDDAGRDFLIEQGVLEHLWQFAADTDAESRGNSTGSQPQQSSYNGKVVQSPPRWQYQHLLPVIPKAMKEVQEKREREKERLETKADKKKSEMDKSEKTEPKMEKLEKSESGRKKSEAKVQEEKVLARTPTSRILDVTPKKLKKPKNVLNSSSQRETPGPRNSQGGEPDYADPVVRLRYLFLLIFALGVVYYFFFKLLWRSYIWIRSLVSRKDDHNRTPLTKEAAAQPKISSEEQGDAGEGSKGSIDTSPQNLFYDETFILMNLGGFATFISVIFLCVYWVRCMADDLEQFGHFVWETGVQFWESVEPIRRQFFTSANDSQA